MRTVFLHGRLKKAFPEPSIRLSVGSIAEATRALIANHPPLAEELFKGAYRIIAGPRKGGSVISEGLLTLNLPSEVDFHLIPVTAGAKNQAMGKIVLGVALAVVSYGVGAAVAGGFGVGAAFGVGFGGITTGAVAMLGAAIAVSGVAMLLTPTPKSPDVNQNESADSKNSFLLNQPANVVRQGQPVPICYGRIRVGSLVISTGLQAEDVPV